MLPALLSIVLAPAFSNVVPHDTTAGREDLATKLIRHHDVQLGRAALWLSSGLVKSQHFDGDWSHASDAQTGDTVFVARGQRAHRLSVVLDDSSVLAFDMPTDAELAQGSLGMLIAFAPQPARSRESAPLLVTNCKTKARLQSWSLGDCLTGGGLNPATGCRTWTCGGGSGNCDVKWTDLEGVVHEDALSCGGTGTFESCAAEICWNWGDGM